MRKTWFVEVPALGGGWTPQLWHGDRPAHVGAEGTPRRFRREPVEVEARHAQLPLESLQMLYGADT